MTPDDLRARADAQAVQLAGITALEAAAIKLLPRVAAEAKPEEVEIVERVMVAAIRKLGIDKAHAVGVIDTLEVLAHAMEVDQMETKKHELLGGLAAPAALFAKSVGLSVDDMMRQIGDGTAVPFKIAPFVAEHPEVVKVAAEWPEQSKEDTAQAKRAAGASAQQAALEKAAETTKGREKKESEAREVYAKTAPAKANGTSKLAESGE